MNFKQKIYFCHHCRFSIDSLENLFFVQERPETGFCSEACIEDFYAPVVKFYEEMEAEVRKELGIFDETEKTKVLTQSSLLIERALTSPSEVWQKENELGEKIYSFIYKPEDNTSFMIILCTVFDLRPAFIFLVTATESLELLSEFKFGVKIERPCEVLNLTDSGDVFTSNDDMAMDKETLQFIEGKKSQLLAELLEIQSNFDIGFEKYHLYDQYLLSTLENPDEIYKVLDRDEDEVFAYIKAYGIEGLPGPLPGEQSSFYYILIAVEVEGGMHDSTLVPILGIPTLDSNLYAYFKRGEKVSSPLKN